MSDVGKLDPSWESAFTVAQKAQPPFIPEGSRSNTKDALVALRFAPNVADQRLTRCADVPTAMSKSGICCRSDGQRLGAAPRIQRDRGQGDGTKSPIFRATVN
jgi:hypothetical protein